MLSCQISIKGLFQRASLSIFRKSLQSFRVSMWSIVCRIPNFQKEPSLRCLFGGSSDQSLHTSKRASKWRLCSFAWSGYLACFGFARVHPPLRLSRFRWLPWVLGFRWLPLGFGLGCLFWGSPFSYPQLSLVCCGAVCAWWGPGA